MSTNEDKFILGGHEFTSRFILGSGKFSLDLVKACIEKAEAQIITLALRRANEGGLANILDYIELSPNLSLVEVTAPGSLTGKTLAEADLRANYGVNVVAIKRFEDLIVPPQPNDMIASGDVLIVVGATEGIQRLEFLG